MSKKNIAVFASGGGSNLQVIIDLCESGDINARVSAVISNNSGSFALERAKKAGIPAFHLSLKKCASQEALDRAVMATLSGQGADIIFLAGYMKKIGEPILEAYKGRIYNIHPSLLPKHGGRGMYGINVHKSVIESGDLYTGATIHHVVAGEYDGGGIIAQKTVAVSENDTPETLASGVLAQEHLLIKETLPNLIN